MADFKRDKLPIYPLPQPSIVLVETHSPLEAHIATGREATTSVFNSARTSAQNVVSKWVAAERKVVREVQKVVPNDEALNPGMLYVGVSTLAGSIIARNRNIALRALLPSSLFLISLNQFQPKLASNLSSEISTLTLHNLPQVHHSASLALSQLRYSRDKTLDTFAHGRRVLEKNVHSAVGVVENTTGLKLANVWSTAKREMTPKEGSAGSGLVKRAQDALARAEGSSGASSEPVVVVSKTPVADAIVPLFDQHSEAQTLPGTNATISHTAPNALPSTTLAVPVYRQTSPSTPSGVQERVAEAAAGGLTVLENKMAEFADQARGLEKEGEKKAGELKERAGEALQRGEAKVKEVVGEVKREEKVVEAKVGEEKKALQTGYKKLV